MAQGSDGKQGSGGAGARWFRNAEGALSTWRSFLAIFVILLGSALLISMAGSGPGTSAVLTAILASGLIYALIVVPVARTDVERRARPRAVTPSTMDSQTSLASRASVTAALLNAMAYANRYGHPLAVGLVDLDMLGEINSGLGRGAGDKALKHVAAVLADTLRMPDRAGRYGDEEFLVILPNTVLKNAVKIAERVRDGVEKSGAGSRGRQIPITVSVGVVQFRKGEDLEDCLTRANKALLLAKSGGRNRVATDKTA